MLSSGSCWLTWTPCCAHCLPPRRCSPHRLPESFLGGFALFMDIHFLLPFHCNLILLCSPSKNLTWHSELAARRMYPHVLWGVPSQGVGAGCYRVHQLCWHGQHQPVGDPAWAPRVATPCCATTAGGSAGGRVHGRPGLAGHTARHAGTSLGAGAGAGGGTGPRGPTLPVSKGCVGTPVALWQARGLLMPTPWPCVCRVKAGCGAACHCGGASAGLLLQPARPPRHGW